MTHTRVVHTIRETQRRSDCYDELLEALEAVIEFGILTAEEDEAMLYRRITAAIKKAKA